MPVLDTAHCCSRYPPWRSRSATGHEELNGDPNLGQKHPLLAMSLLSREAWTLASWSSDLMPAEARSLTRGSSTKRWRARSSKKKPGDRWLSIADRHPNLLPHRCGPIQRGADCLKIQNLPTRRMYLRVSADPSETTASRHFNLSLPVLLSVSRREFLQSPVANSLHEWLGNTFGCAVAILTLSRKSWIPGLRASRRMARA